MKNLLLIIVLSNILAVAFADSGQQAEVKTATPAALAQARQQNDKASSKTAAVDLESAYKREFAFLAAQKRELQKRIRNYQAKATQDQRKLEKQIERLQEEDVENSTLIDNLEMQLADAKRMAAAFDERSDVLNMTFDQAKMALATYGIDLGKEPEFQQPDEKKLQYIFTRALNLLQELGQIHSEPGKFYRRDGTQTQGQIIYLGNIAAYGFSSNGAGALAPAGGKRFKLWKQPTDDVAEQLAKGRQPELLKLFLYESRNKAIEEHTDKTVLSVIESGGIIGWIIVLLGALGGVLIIARCFLLFINSRDTKKATTQVVQRVTEGKLDQAKMICVKKGCAITRVMASTLKHLKDDRDHMEDVIAEAILNESAPINRYGSAILVIASVAPLLGLLGTVTGMISTFDIITEFGTGDPKLLSSGISVALVTTELGLIVAIPNLLFGSLLSAWANDIKREMEKSALTITNLVLGGDNARIMQTMREQQTPSPLSANIQAA